MSAPDSGAGQVARVSAELQKKLADISLPAITGALDQMTQDLGAPGQVPGSVAAAYGEVRSDMREDFEAERDRGAATIRQRALQGGIGYAGDAIGAATERLGRNLSANEAGSLRALRFQEAQAGLSQTNQLLSNITGSAGSLLSGSLRFGQNALQADQVLQSMQAAAASRGSTIGGIAGTVLGGIAGTFLLPGLGTAAGASLGGALGGAAGGYLGGGG